MPPRGRYKSRQVFLKGCDLGVFSKTHFLYAGGACSYSIYPEITHGFTALTLPPKFAMKYLAFIIIFALL